MNIVTASPRLVTLVISISLPLTIGTAIGLVEQKAVAMVDLGAGVIFFGCSDH